MMQIDLNADMGELPASIADGTQEALMPYLASVNVACGGHAGDAETMRATIEQARRWKLALGAHPGYPDRARFGREPLDLPLSEIADFVYCQVRECGAIAAACGVQVGHVKPHGALYNQAARDRDLALAIADGVARWSREVALVGLAGSVMLDVWQEAGFAVAAEAFVDRRYDPDGSLRSRQLPGAVLQDPTEAAQQALRIVQQGTVVTSGGSAVAVRAQTLCLHSDTANAVLMAREVAGALHGGGIAIRPFR